MSRAKRGHQSLDNFGDDSQDETYGRPSPRKKQKQSSSSRSKTKKRSGYGRGGDDDDDDDEDDGLSDNESIDDITDEEPSPVARTQTGRPARRSTVSAKYEEPDSDEGLEAKDEIEESDNGEPQPRQAKVAKRTSLMVKLKMPNQPATARGGRSRTASKSVKPFDPLAVRRSSRISHDDSDPLVSLTASGRHERVERPGSVEPEPSSRRQTRGGKRMPTTSTVIEASFEESQDPHEVGLTQQTENAEGEQDSQQGEAEPALPRDDETKEGVIAESVHGEEEDEDEEQEPVGIRRRSQRISQTSATTAPAPVTRSTRRTRRGDLEEKDTSDFDPAAEGPIEEEEMSNSDSPQKQSQRSEASSQQGRRSGRIAKKRNSQRASVEGSDLEIDADELAEEAAELKASKPGQRRRRRTSMDIMYDQPKLRQREKKDYRIIRPELYAAPDDEEAPSQAAAGLRKGKGFGGAGAYRSLYSTQGPFGSAGGPTSLFGLSGGLAAAGGADSDSSDDDMMQKAPRGIGGALGMTPTAAVSHALFPPNFSSDAVLGGSAGAAATSVGKVKDKKLLADADPLGVDQNVNFDGVGGLEQHINKLKEMVMLPLLYPEIFLRMHIVPPRGVLFHGPPGTGKTLLARALASSVSSQGKKVTFYMRKGADALSKWVGEAERQLRLLFEEARKTQPSIIFFDEIDGLAPVRSSKQEQIHASIVATLLALMDGMDGRGQVIVIGATNRPDSVDPALRRPGRFDREFYFPLPNQEGRRSIIDIHTKDWDPPLKPEFKDSLSALTKGYGGADLRALCTEAALNAVQGTYPQIYQSNEKLLIDPSTIKVLAKDFMVSVNKMIPSSERSAPTGAAPLETSVEPLLRDALSKIAKILDEVLPESKKPTALEEAEYEDREDEFGFEREMMQQRFDRARIFRPRLLVYGPQGMGQQYIGGALLNRFERLHVQSFDLSVLYSESGRSAEAAVVQLFNEARRHRPSVIYIPNVDVWYNIVGESVLRLFTGLLRSLPPNEPVLVLGIMELDPAAEEKKPDWNLVKDLFGFSKTSHVELEKPSQAQRAEYFQRVFDLISMAPSDFPDPTNRKKRELPRLELAPVLDTPQKALTKQELKAQKKNDRMTLNWLKIKLQPVVDQLKKAYKRFVRPPIDPDLFGYLFDEQDPTMVSTDLPNEQRVELRPYEMSKDEKGNQGIRERQTGNFYYNLELITIERRFVNGYYKRPKDFLADIKRLVKDAKTSGDPERIIKANQMLTNVETDVEMLERTDSALVAECEKVYGRELEREHQQQDKMRQAEREGREVPPIVSNVPPDESHTTTEASGPIVLGVPVPGRPSVPNVPSQPLSRSPLSNGYYAGSERNFSSDPLRLEYDVDMSNTQELPRDPTQGSDPNASRLSTVSQQRRVQTMAVTSMAHGSQAVDYHNSASTTTSEKKSDDKSHRSSGQSGSNNTQSTNGTVGTGHPDWSAMQQQFSGGSSQLPDTQEMRYTSGSSQSQPSSQLSQPSQSHIPSGTAVTSLVPANMAPPTRQGSASLSHVLNNDPTSPPISAPSQPQSQLQSQPHSQPQTQPVLILNQTWLQDLHALMVERTTGFSVEQLEQMNAAVMGTVWRRRGDWNRTRVGEEVRKVFNDTVTDIEECQKIAEGSQEKAATEGTGAGLGGSVGSARVDGSWADAAQGGGGGGGGVGGAAPEMAQGPQWR